MNLSALLINSTNYSSYRVELDREELVLVQGDNMYLNAFNNDLIPREGFLSLNNLATDVCCRWLEDKSDNSSIETSNISPVEGQKYTIDQPILRGSTFLAIVTPSCYIILP